MRAQCRYIKEGIRTGGDSFRHQSSNNISDFTWRDFSEPYRGLVFIGFDPLVLPSPWSVSKASPDGS